MSDSVIEQAYAARQAGQLATAEALCRQILADAPAHQGALSLIGLCLAEAGNPVGARALIEGAAAAEPDNWRLLLNLSALREIEGDLNAATQAAEKATILAPERFEPWGRLGDLHGRGGAYAEATMALDRALTLNPNHPGIALLLAGAALEAGDLAKAEQALPIIARAAPNHPQLWPLRTHLARRVGDQRAFAEAATQWLRAEPDSVPARVAAAHACAQIEDYHGAVALYRPLVERDAKNANHTATLARYLLWARDFVGAEQHYQRALHQRPDHAEAAAGLARLHIFKGSMDIAAAFAERAVRADPANPDGYSQLALATGEQLSDEQLAALDKLAKDSTIEPENRAVAWFTIGDVRHRRREHDRAFDAWQQANGLKQMAAQRAGTDYDPIETERLADRIIQSFTSIPSSDTGPQKTGPTPIFIIGMPRSGTTLLDSALARHAAITSGGELPLMPAALKSFLAWAEKEAWQGGAIPEPIAVELRNHYLRQYATYGIAETAYVTDKQPINFWSVGLIRHLFPAAPILHIRRDALETGFSIYRNNFTRSWPFTTTMADIGHYHGQYARLMAHWQIVAGDAMAQTDHAALVGDFEGELRRLLSQFDLPWDAGCLDYYRSGGIVTTLSAAQVRKAPSAAHLHATLPYAHRLGPLRDALAKAGITS